MADKICDHCGHIGRQYTIVDSEGKACELRIQEGQGKHKELAYSYFHVCPECLKINVGN